MILVIDAGHGGKDPGNLGTGRFKATEKTVTLEVALLLRDYITERFPDVEIVRRETHSAHQWQEAPYWLDRASRPERSQTPKS